MMGSIRALSKMLEESIAHGQKEINRMVENDRREQIMVYGWTDNPERDADRYDSLLAREESRRPVCCACGSPIITHEAFIGDVWDRSRTMYCRPCVEEQIGKARQYLDEAFAELLRETVMNQMEDIEEDY